jgi:hypothetical protein
MVSDEFWEAMNFFPFLSWDWEEIGVVVGEISERDFTFPPSRGRNALYLP